MRLRRVWMAAPLIVVALLVVVAGSASAADDGSTTIVTADQSGELRVVSVAQADDPESDSSRRLLDRVTSERVDAVVIALWSIAVGMTVMLGLFLWHTSPRRRLRLARRRSTEMYGAEGREPEGLAGAAAEAVGEVEAAGNEAAGADAEAAGEVEAAGNDIAGADAEAAGEVEAAGNDIAGADAEVAPRGKVAGAAAGHEAPAGEGDESVGRGANLSEEGVESAETDPVGEPATAGTAARERGRALWLQLRQTLGLD